MAPTVFSPDLVDILRSLRLLQMRKCAPDLLATAKAQRCEPADGVAPGNLLGRRVSGLRHPGTER